MIGDHLPAFVAAVAGTLLLIPVYRTLVRRAGRVRVPAGPAQPVSLLGGTAILLCVVAGMAVLGGLRQQAVLVASAVGMAMVGLVHDLSPLKPATKLIAAVVLASAVQLLGYRLFWPADPTFEILMTILWVVGLTHAFALFDNVDRLCGGVALIAGAALLASRPTGLPGTEAFDETRYLVLLLGAVTGFLAYGVVRGPIALGNAGSLFIGFSFAVVTLSRRQAEAGEFVSLSVVAVPLMLLLGASNRLAVLGDTKRRTAALLWTTAAAAAIVAGIAIYSNVAAVLQVFGPVAVAGMLLIAPIVFTVAAVRADVPVDEHDPESPPQPPALTVSVGLQRGVGEVLLDVALIAAAYYGAYRLRFEGGQFALSFGYFTSSLPVVIAGQLIALFVVGTYRGVRQLFSLRDVFVLVRGVVLGTLSMQLAILYLYRYTNYSRTVFIIYAALLLFLLTAVRASSSFRLVGELASRRGHRIAERLVIYGAGARGALAVREVLMNPRALYRLLGFIDDDPEKNGGSVHGYRVLGSHLTLEEMMATGQVDTVLIGSRSIESQRLESVFNLSVKYGVKLIELHVQLEHVDSRALRPLRLTARRESVSSADTHS